MYTVYRLFSFLPLVFSLVILLAGLLCSFTLDYIPLIVVAVVCIWAAQIIIFSNSLPWYFVLRILFVLIIYVLTWLQVILVYRANSLEIPFPSKSITAIRAVVRFDSTRSENGNTVVEVLLEQASNRRGDIGAAGGSLLVVSPENTLFLFGQHLDVYGELVMYEDTWFFFAQESEIIPNKHRFVELYHRTRMRILSVMRVRLDRLPRQVTSLSEALLLGRFDTWSPLRKMTTESGCAHVVALSGMHLQAIIGMLSLLLSKIVKKRNICFFTLPFACIYVAIVGNKPSLIRALTMVVLPHFHKRIETKYALANVVVLHAWVAPQTLISPGSALSYGAITSILYVSPAIAQSISTIMPKKLAQLVATTLSATLCTAPISLVLFGSWYGIGVLLSPFLAPVALLFLGVTFLWLLIPCVPLMILAQLMVDLFTKIVTWGSSWSLEHTQFSTNLAWLWSVVSLLTVVGFLQYANRIARRRSYRKHDMGFSLRFPPSNNPTA